MYGVNGHVWHRERGGVSCNFAIHLEDEEKKKQPGGEPKPKRPRRPRLPQTGNSNYRSGKGWIPQRDPLVLDLDGDGIETTGTADGAYFDHNADGHYTRNACSSVTTPSSCATGTATARSTGSASLIVQTHTC